MRRQSLFLGLLLLATMTMTPTQLRAHGLVHIDYVDNKIYIQPGDAGLVFWDANEGPYINFDFASDGILPIANISAGGHLTVGDQISLQVMGPLLYDSGSGLGLSSPGNASVQLVPYGATVTGSTGQLSPSYWTTVQADGFVHEHYNFYFSNEVAGVYGIEFRILTNHPGIAPSDPYILLFNNGVAEEDMPAVMGNFLSLLSPSLLGDLNHDGFVGQDDLNIILGLWGQHVADGTVGDINKDDFIGQDDLNVILSEWGQGTLPTSVIAKTQAIPEVSSFALTFAIGFIGLFVWRTSRKQLVHATCW